MQLFSFSTLGALLVVVIMTSSTAQANLSGYVGMSGEIVEAACVIDRDHIEQRLLLDSISPDRLVRGEGGGGHSFSINLINCNLGRQNAGGRWLGFQITFDGLAEGGRFKLQGESQGLAIEIQDDRGFVALPGVAMPPHPVTTGGVRLNYNLRLIGNQALMKAGSHFALLKYKLDYY